MNSVGNFTITIFPLADFLRFGDTIRRVSLFYYRHSYVVCKEKLPRMGTGSPFDPTKEKWKDRELAPAFCEDTDPVWNGHK